MKILFIASECVPFSKTGGLADVVGALPKVLAARAHEVSVFLPRYRVTPPGRVVIPRLTLPLGSRVHHPAVQQGPTLDGVRFFFLEYPPYFDRENLYVDNGKDYPDNAQRFALFARAALEFARQTGAPDLFHCHDWQAALVPVFLKSVYADDPQLGRVPTILTVHNLGYQGLFPAGTLKRLGLPGALFRLDGLKFRGKVNFLKGGLVFADFLTTVSRKYAQEIQTPEYGHGLDSVIRRRAATVAGILNGVDYSQWNPETDSFLVANYSRENLEGKRLCKQDLLQQFRLPAARVRKPLVGIVSRFAAQKGFDLIAKAAEKLMKNDLQIVVLGTGEPKFEKLFRRLARRFPQRIGVRIAYDNSLAHKIEAGSDMFLMPSRYEPCGLNQIYSLRYGTVPLVRATGGLDDTIEPFDLSTGRGTGFKFRDYSAKALLGCLARALRLYARNPGAWRQLIRNGMEKDYSWDNAAAEYEQLYRRVVKFPQKG
ncbi:MAG: glycogen synthase GlgA [Candidatus Acidoferrales bacterium]